MLSKEIKKRWPIFNTSQKRWEDVYGLFLYEDQNRYQRLAIDKNRKRLSPVYSFHYLADGHAIVRKLIKEYNLCPRLCYLQTDNESCIGIKEKYCYGACEQTESPDEYNQRIGEAVASLQQEPSFIIKDKGLNGDDQSCILVLNGHLYGMGYLQADIQITDVDTLKEQLTEFKENSFTRNLVRDFAIRFPEKVIMLETSIV